MSDMSVQGSVKDMLEFRSMSGIFRLSSILDYSSWHTSDWYKVLLASPHIFKLLAAYPKLSDQRIPVILATRLLKSYLYPVKEL
jgi:hypothetical protein